MTAMRRNLDLHDILLFLILTGFKMLHASP